jgi:hypothetical protein
VFSREYLERLGAEAGFRPDTLEKVLRLERLLTGIRRHPFLKERLVLKGGTALSLFFGGPVPRLSAISISTMSTPWTARRCCERSPKSSAPFTRSPRAIATGCSGARRARGPEDPLLVSEWTGLG